MKKLYLFLLVNIFISSIIAIRYFGVPGSSFTWDGSLFAFIAVLGHFFSAYLLIFVISIPILWINKKITNICLALIFSLLQIVLYIDTIVFQQYRFHISESVLSMVFSGQVVDFSAMTYILISLLIFVCFVTEYLVLYLLDKKFNHKTIRPKILIIPTVFLASCLVISHLIHMVAFYYAYSPIMIIKEYIPLYRPFTSKKIMGYFDKSGQRKELIEMDSQHASIYYPKKDLMINPDNLATPNIMFIVLDSWRYDTFSPDISPNTYRFVQQNNGIIFNNHYSTGNATRTGIFGLFYGIPGTYWDSFIRNRIPSLFITTLQKENYNIGIFTSAKVTSPEFDRTAFLTIKNLRISSKNGLASSRDKQITDDWLNWYESRDKSNPSFSFLFFNAPHAYDFPNDFDVKFKPVGDLNYMTLNNNTDPIPIFNRYKQSVYYDDYLLQKDYD